MNKTTKIKDFCRLRNPFRISKKSQSMGKALLGIVLVIVLFGAGFYFSGNNAGVAGNVVKITGMAGAKW